MKRSKVRSIPNIGVFVLIILSLMTADSFADCTHPPKSLIGWWSGDKSAQDLTEQNDGVWVGTEAYSPGQVGYAFSLPQSWSTNNYIEIADDPSLDLGVNNFTVEFWFSSGGTGGLVEKYELHSPGSPGNDIGFSIAIDIPVGPSQQELRFWLAGATGSLPFPLNAGLPSTQWIHVAVVVDRDIADGGAIYLNGVKHGLTFDAQTIGDISNSRPLLIGAYTALGSLYDLSGVIDEVEIFNRALSEKEIQDLYNAGNDGKCKEYCHAPEYSSICVNVDWVTVPLTLCNYSLSDQSYYLTLSGLPAGASAGCTVDGPPIIQILEPQPINVLAGQCKTVQAKIKRPIKLDVVGEVGCYQATMTNAQTGKIFISKGSVRGIYDWRWCPVEVYRGPIAMLTGPGIWHPIRLRNTSDEAVAIQYEFDVAPPDDDSANQVVSLNSLEPGISVRDSVIIPPFDTATISVGIEMLDLQPFAFHELIFRVDSDGDGIYEPVWSWGLRSVVHPDCDEDGLSDYRAISDGISSDFNGNGIPDNCESRPEIKIEKTHGTLQGHYLDVSITIENSDLEMGGFDFLIAYDASALTFSEAQPGELLDTCDWEYFTYRFGAYGNCGDACPSGLLRLIALAETNNGPYHPSCYGPPDTDPHELARMTFMVSNNRVYNGQYVPIEFFWGDCGDNSLSSVDGEVLYIDRAIYDFEGNLIWDEEDDVQYPEDGRIPFVGAADYCLNPDPDKPSAVRSLEFVYGGVDIIPDTAIDARGDINCNGLANEIADAVMFTNYFIMGLTAFENHAEASIAASDVNADGMALSVGDLVYLIRVITGDALPYQKPVPYAVEASVNALVNHSAVGVSATSPTDIGAGYFVFEYSSLNIGEPHLINGASAMSLKYGNENGILKVLVYSLEKGVSVPAGVENMFVIPIHGEGSIRLTDVQLSDYQGNLLAVKNEIQPVLPKAFALHQNYPNPFNAGTTIAYELPQASGVKIEIINVLGQIVTTVLDGRESAGIHTVQWDGNDNQGAPAASGIYVYRMTAGMFLSERKMVLLK